MRHKPVFDHNNLTKEDLEMLVDRNPNSHETRILKKYLGMEIGESDPDEKYSELYENLDKIKGIFSKNDINIEEMIEQKGINNDFQMRRTIQKMSLETPEWEDRKSLHKHTIEMIDKLSRYYFFRLMKYIFQSETK